MDYSKLNLKIRSVTTLCGLKLPLLIDIANIKHSESTIVDCVITISESGVVYDLTDSPFQANNRLSSLLEKVKTIWESIDLETALDSDTILALLGIQTLEDFTDLCVYSDICTVEELYRILTEIGFYKEKLKKMFIEECSSMFDIKRELPKITLKDDSVSSYVAKYSEHFAYPEAMYPLQFVAEYPMSTWFPENSGKSFMEWSWREVECKKLYMYMKNTTESFRELVKAKALEVTREK